jgi:tRNA 2-thiouridine synthesizing protein A
MEMFVAPDTKLDCLGLYCPVPILKIREVVKSLAIGQTVEMLSDDPASEADVKSWTARTGHELLGMERNGAVFRFLVRKTR